MQPSDNFARSMKVAVDISGLSVAKSLVFKTFIEGLVQKMAQQNPGDHFILIKDRDQPDPVPVSENIEWVDAGRSAANRLLKRYWLNVQLPALLKKKEAELFLSTNGSCSLAVKIPTILLVPHPDLLVKQGGYAQKFLNKAGTVVFFSEKLKESALQHYKIPVTNTVVMNAAVPGNFSPLSYEEKAVVRNSYTEGKEYFIYTGGTGQDNILLNLLKAFSIFKKRQQSGIKLMLTGEPGKKGGTFETKLATYKYRDDVVLPGSLTVGEKARVLAAAYAYIDPSPEEHTGIPALEAAASDVPVIAAGDQPLLGKDTFLESATKDHVDMAAQMMLLYKDEALRKEFIEKGRAAAKHFSMDRSAGRLWELITKDRP